MNKIRLACCLLLLGMISFDSLGIAGTADSPKEKAVLFICTGNFYRSRLAEALFNFYSSKNNSAWKAFSRGLDLTTLTPSQKQSRISELTIKGLESLEVPTSFAGGRPTQLTVSDLDRSSIIVALNQSEHRPVLEKKYPAQKSKITYWEIGDSKTLNPTQAIELINNNVKAIWHCFIYSNNLVAIAIYTHIFCTNSLLPRH